MYVNHYLDVEEKEVIMEGAKDVTIRWLVTPKFGAENFAMRYFVVKKGGHTPLHTHNYEHEIFVVKGEGYLTDGKRKIKLVQGSFAYVKPNELHQFVNEDAETFEFLCLIPNKKYNIPEEERGASDEGHTC
ncbi:hypothetical protein PAP_00900 [Palaeococcus pacificus DY20341]|uniref:Cupin type-2 domain-containing protein n=1 Tax=Palaeococcus pacificus DY20341 TaxID=1343739 RepID=A0A075LW09_9EURY|nr:cupin domain-containing protein [Palaeococcus pacificus]AIF68623.1 hypothetical protein PAP_00900 [Palaeococcus pacificus DY20341]